MSMVLVFRFFPEVMGDWGNMMGDWGERGGEKKRRRGGRGEGEAKKRWVRKRKRMVEI